MDIAIHVENLWYKYPGSQDLYTLKGIDLYLYSGNIYIITGPNGAGKSTLLMVLAGLLKPVKGDVTINNVSIFRNRDMRRYIGILFQNPDAMLFNPSVYDELVYSIKQIESSEKIIADRLSYWLNYFSLNTSILSQKPYTLSYGYKKLVALISILMYSPPILLLDEPHTGLAKRFVDKLLKLVVEHKMKGGLTVIATHNLKLYRDIADSFIRLENGSIVKIRSVKTYI
ncbi:MAG: ABC transporter ATP-binding protein [Ignisphaera sp.]